MTERDLSDYSMLDLFRMEVDNQAAQLEDGLQRLRATGAGAAELEQVMRAAHSIKGAARMVGVELATRLAHAMEDLVVAVQRGETGLDEAALETLERGLARLRTFAARNDEELARGRDEDEAAVADLEAACTALRDRPPEDVTSATRGRGETSATTPEPPTREAPGRALRISSGRLERLTWLAGEALVEVRALGRHLEGEWRRHEEETQLLHALDQALAELRLAAPEHAQRLRPLKSRLENYLRGRRHRRERLEQIERRLTPVVERLHRAVMDTRMRPFADIAEALPPLVKELAARLGKETELVLEGKETRIDRDILERLATPLKHLIQNALDHGLEPPEERVGAGKPPVGRITVASRHRNGRLEITVTDDGRGIDRAALRERALARRLVAPEVAARLAEDDWFEFLFMPGFSTRDEVTELSGRGVGLDVVRDMVHGLGGELTVHSEPGRGTRFTLALPLTLAVMRVLLVELDGAPYALPMVRVERLLKVPTASIDNQGRPTVTLEEGDVPVLDGEQVLELPARAHDEAEAHLVLLREGRRRVALRVGRWLGTREIALQTLDQGLGKIPHVFAAGQLDDGTPLLVLDVDDLLRSVEYAGPLPEGGGLRVLVADDSLTVRNLLRQILTGAGYQVDLAEDGVDAWSALHTRTYDLLLTDVDMPHMDGIELVRRLRGDPRLRRLPVVILSYKGGEQDRRRGLEAGADYYLAKSEFDGERLLQAVGDLIGEARPA